MSESTSHRTEETAANGLERELRRERDRARQILDLAGVILVAIDSDETVSLINRKGCEVLRAGREEIIGANWFDTFIPIRNREMVRRIFRRLMASEIEPVEHFENTVVNSHGEEITIAWHNSVITDDDGTVTGTLSSGEDVTLRRRAEQALRDSETRFRTMADVMPLIFWMVSPDWQRVEYVSPSIETVYGLTAQQFYDHPSLWIEAIHPDDRERVGAHYQAHHGEVTDQEYRIVRTNGAVRWIRDVTTPVHDSDGTLVHLAGFAEDVTDRHIAAEALLESETNFRAVAENLNDGIFIAAASDKVHVFANHRAAELSGYSVVELLGMTNIDLLPPEEVEKVARRFAERVNGGKPPRQYETSILTRDGRRLPIEITAAKTEWKGEPAVIAVVRDISERLLFQERLKGSLKEKELLLKEVHHRVKNNLQIISTLLDLRASSFSRAEDRQTIENLRHRVGSMAVIHERLFLSDDLSRIDAAAFLQSIVAHLHSALGATGGAVRSTVDVAELTFSVDTAVPCGLLTTELLSNALQHAFPEGFSAEERGPFEVRVGLRPLDEERLLLEVADNGVGLPEELDWRDSPSLGLQLVDSLVRQLKGSAEVDRSAGTSFSVAFSHRKTRAHVERG